jgi:hypothetical protein
MLAIAQEYFDSHYKSINPSTATSDFDISEADLSHLLGKYAQLNKILSHYNLDTVHLVKPLLDGKQICDLYGIKPGKAIKFLMD